MAAMTAPTNGSHQTLLVDSGTVLRKHYNPEKQRILDSIVVGSKNNCNGRRKLSKQFLAYG